LQSGRKAYVHLVRGEVQVNGHALKTGDAAMLDKETQVSISHGVDAEVLVFDLAP
jgi:redox-sensitive bicupin YhaK (pirin superfamily)